MLYTREMKSQLFLPMLLSTCFLLLDAARAANSASEQCWNKNCLHRNSSKLCNRPSHECVERPNKEGVLTIHCIPSGGSQPQPDVTCPSSFFKICLCDTSDNNDALCVCKMPNGAKVSIVLLSLFGVGVLIICLAVIRWFLRKKYKVEERMKKLASSEGDRRLFSIEERPVSGPRIISATGQRPRISTAGVPVSGPRIATAGVPVSGQRPRISTAGVPVSGQRPRISTTGVPVSGQRPRISTTGQRPRISTGTESGVRQP